MTSMVGRVARAIWSVRREEEDRCDMELEDMGRDHSVWAEARAAIEAMREPTQAIIEAAEDIAVGYDDFALHGDGTIYLGIPGYPQKATQVWHQLIDAAMEDKQ